MSAIEVVGLAKAYCGGPFRSPAPALCGVSLTVPRGAAFGLIGPNGAGKTTFVKALLGVVRPGAGSIRVLGEAPETVEVRRQIGYVPERLHFACGTTASSFLFSVARMRGIEDRPHEVARQLGRVGLAPEASTRISTFSKGMRQRLAVAAALLGQPELLILDEPTDGIDPLGRAEVRRIMSEERARGATIFLNSHLLAETERACDRIGILVDGRLAREGELDALCRDENRWQARFADNPPAAALEAIGFTFGSNGHWMVHATTPAALDAQLARARQAGAILVGLTPMVRSLEEILADAVEGGAV